MSERHGRDRGIAAPAGDVASLPAPLLRARGLTVVVDQRTLIENVSLDLYPGRIVTVIGPNGSGKSTLMRALLGLQPVRAGQIEKAEDLRIGYMPQRFQIDPILPISVARFLRLARRRSRAELERALDEVHVAHVLDQPMASLSGGEQQRVLLASALLDRPNLLILDEPTANLDIGAQAAFFDKLTTLRDASGVAVLLVSHDLHMVMAATDHVICLNGHVCCSGRPDAVSSDPAYLSLFAEPVGQERMVLYRHGPHDHSHGELADGEPPKAERPKVERPDAERPDSHDG